jgi:hypothetical protein
MNKNPLQLARKYPQQAEAIFALFGHRADLLALRELLGTCTCTSDTLACTCPPEYSKPKATSYAGHTPE